MHSTLIALKLIWLIALTSVSMVPINSTKAKEHRSDDRLRINLITSVAWHGKHIFPHNIAVINKIRQEFPGLVLHHFISPNYFLNQSEEERHRRAKLIQSVVKDGDKFGLFLEARSEIVETSGVLFRSRPTFFGGDHISCNQPGSCEQDALLGVYSRDELVRIFAQSLRVLRDNGFNPDSKWMSRYWEGDAQIAQAAIRSGLQQDFSAIPPSRVQSRLRHSPGFAWLRATWSRLEQDLAQPYTRKFGRGQVLVVPQSAGVIDYATPEELLATVEDLVQKAKASQRRDLVLQLLFHQETADSMHARLITTLRGIHNLAQQDSLDLASGKL